MIVFPNAKINLGLNIVSKRNDGYHDLETIFYPIMIKDALEIIVSGNGTDSFYESGAKVGVDTYSNLVMKALVLMREYHDIPFLDIHLLKGIPFAAGIGGGSADGTFMLKLLNDKFSLGVSNSDLAKMSKKLGADCPFFVYNKPLFASGIGDVFEDVDVSLNNYYLVLVKPNIHVSTKEAFAFVKPKYPEISLKEVIKKPVSEWKNLLKNDFEDSIFPQHKGINDIKEKLYNLGAVYASMSGSGSSVYGIFENKTDLKGNFPDCYIWEQQ